MNMLIWHRKVGKTDSRPVQRSFSSIPNTRWYSAMLGERRALIVPPAWWRPQTLPCQAKRMALADNPQSRDPRSWYQLEVWRKRRRVQLREFPLCRLCELDGKIVPALIADHITPHKGSWNDFRLGPLQSLCSNCHESRKKIIEGRGYDPTIGADGYPTDAKHPVNQL